MDQLQSLAGLMDTSETPITVQIGLAVSIVLVLYLVYTYSTRQRPFPEFPVIDLKQEEGLGPLWSWIKRGEAVVAKGRRTTNGIFQAITPIGPMLLLPNRFTNELRNHPDLSFTEATAKMFFPGWPGFQPFDAGLSGGGLIQHVVRVNLSQSLNLVTDDLVDECDNATRLLFPASKEWQTVKIKQGVLDLVARLSSRVFLGIELCRERRWLEIAKDYTVHAFVAAMKLRFTPVILRPLGLLFFKECRQIRQEIVDARVLINSEVERRKERTQKALDAGQKPPKTADTIGWMYEISQRKGLDADLVAAQLSLSLAAIHTTTEGLLYAILDCCRDPSIVQPLRDEMVSVLSENGWSKTSLYKMKLVDSFLKESQRYNSLCHYTMNRLAKRDIELSDGTIVPQGAILNILGTLQDPNVFPEPQQFRADRFLLLRSIEGQENSWQHVSTSPEHLGFGHGQHACPGRFFATNELKVALSFMLLNYEFKSIPSDGKKEPSFEGRRIIDQDLQVMMRARTPEIDLMSLTKVEA